MSRCDAGEMMKPSRAHADLACKIFSPNEHARMRAYPGILRRSLGAHACERARSAVMACLTKPSTQGCVPAQGFSAGAKKTTILSDRRLFYLI